MSSDFSLCVYCGSRPGVDPVFAQAARATGQAIGQRNWRLVYGGGKVGLMGLLADATLAAGGQVLGVIPENLLNKEVGHHGLTELRVVKNMHERKSLMFEQAKAFLTLPGGIGTFEELFEMWTWHQLGVHHKPLGLLNVSGYYDPMLDMMRKMVDQGFLSEQVLALLRVSTRIEELLDQMAA